MRLPYLSGILREHCTVREGHHLPVRGYPVCYYRDGEVRLTGREVMPLGTSVTLTEQRKTAAGADVVFRPVPSRRALPRLASRRPVPFGFFSSSLQCMGRLLWGRTEGRTEMDGRKIPIRMAVRFRFRYCEKKTSDVVVVWRRESTINQCLRWAPSKKRKAEHGTNHVYKVRRIIPDCMSVCKK